jgi:hypothetical protein
MFGLKVFSGSNRAERRGPVELLAHERDEVLLLQQQQQPLSRPHNANANGSSAPRECTHRCTVSDGVRDTRSKFRALLVLNTSARG